MSFHVLLMVALMVVGAYLLYVEYLILKQRKEMKYLTQTLHALLIILDKEGIIEVKEVGDDE